MILVIRDEFVVICVVYVSKRYLLLNLVLL